MLHSKAGLLLARAEEPEQELSGIISTIYFDVTGLGADASVFAAVHILPLAECTLFICDWQVKLGPATGRAAKMILLAAKKLRRFGIVPRLSLLQGRGLYH